MAMGLLAFATGRGSAGVFCHGRGSVLGSAAPRETRARRVPSSRRTARVVSSRAVRTLEAARKSVQAQSGESSSKGHVAPATRDRNAGPGAARRAERHISAPGRGRDRALRRRRVPAPRAGPEEGAASPEGRRGARALARAARGRPVPVGDRGGGHRGQPANRRAARAPRRVISHGPRRDRAPEALGREGDGRRSDGVRRGARERLARPGAERRRGPDQVVVERRRRVAAVPAARRRRGRGFGRARLFRVRRVARRRAGRAASL
mmetsp:Transcript_19656/g.58226  ORF Transcript_19656/g.58226 Transcript_19656/m.58226 type:complete len:264 (-) Transcript_19656:339-1130(-)